jgi:hypothetical protein
MTCETIKARRKGFASGLFLAIVAMLLAVGQAQAQTTIPDSYALVSAVPEWTTDIVAAAGPDRPADLNLANCCLPKALHVPVSGVRIAADAGHGPVSAPTGFTLLDLGQIDPAVQVYVKAAHVGGMRLFLPVFSDPLRTYAQFQLARGLVNKAGAGDVDSTRVWYYSTGVNGGNLTFAVLDKDGHEIAPREYAVVLPGRLQTFRLATAIPDGGSVVDLSGFITSGGLGAGGGVVNNPSSAPDGLTFVWYTTGPESGKTAPLVVVPITGHYTFSAP